MEHHLARDLLEGYTEDSLEPETRSQLEAHLKTCEECRAIIDATESPVELLAVPKLDTDWDEKRMRKTIRRTLGRLVFDALTLWIAGAIALTLVSAFAIQPMLINRGDRSRAAAIATWDLAILTTPGATVNSWLSDATLFGREISVDVARYTGSNLEPLGTYQTDLGVWDFKRATGGNIDPFLGGESRTFNPERLPEDTVATVELHWWETPITVTQAAALQPDPEKIRLLWVGFSVAPAFPEAQEFFADPDYVLGYNPCADPDFAENEDGDFSSGSSGGGGSRSSCFFFGQATVNQSLAELRRATTNLAEHAFLADALKNSTRVSLRNIETVSTWLAGNEPQVVSLVITGPSDNISDIVASSGAEGVSLLDIDFWNWEG